MLQRTPCASASFGFGRSYRSARGRRRRANRRGQRASRQTPRRAPPRGNRPMRIRSHGRRRAAGRRSVPTRSFRRARRRLSGGRRTQTPPPEVPGQRRAAEARRKYGDTRCCPRSDPARGGVTRRDGRAHVADVTGHPSYSPRSRRQSTPVLRIARQCVTRSLRLGPDTPALDDDPAAAEVGHRDECRGRVVAVAAVVDQPDLAVDPFELGVRQAQLDGCQGPRHCCVVVIGRWPSTRCGAPPRRRAASRPRARTATRRRRDGSAANPED